MRATLFFQTNVALAIVLLVISAVFNGFSFGTKIALGYLISGLFIGSTYFLNKANARKQWPKGKVILFFEAAFPLAVCITMIIVDKQPIADTVNLLLLVLALAGSGYYLFKAPKIE